MSYHKIKLIAWLIYISHRLDVLVADEAPIHLRADDGELPVEVIRRLPVRVRHLVTKDRLVRRSGSD